MSSAHSAPVSLPRIAITFCTQCRWMLRAAYFAQELLSTFSTQIGEVALVPATGGVFCVELTYQVRNPAGDPDAQTSGEQVKVEQVLLWDRKAEGGFPETKVLKQRVRDYIDPGRDLGHSDRGGKKKEKVEEKVEEKTGEESVGGGSAVAKGQVQDGKGGVEVGRNADGSICEDCN